MERKGEEKREGERRGEEMREREEGRGRGRLKKQEVKRGN